MTPADRDKLQTLIVYLAAKYDAWAVLWECSESLRPAFLRMAESEKPKRPRKPKGEK